MRDDIVAAVTVAAFAAVVTAHVAIVVGLLRRSPRWRSAAALVAFPLAPAFAWKSHMRARAFVWVGAASAYVVMRFVGLR